LRRGGVAGVAARSIAGHAVAVVPAARILAEVAADRAGVADLRARDLARRVGEQPEALAHERARLDLGERRERADLEAVGCLANASQLVEAVQVDDRARSLATVLEPVERIVA